MRDVDHETDRLRQDGPRYFLATRQNVCTQTAGIFLPWFQDEMLNVCP